MAALVQQKKSLLLILVKQKQDFTYVSILMVVMVICFEKEKKIHKFKANDINFPSQFCPESISKIFGAMEFRDVSFKDDVHDFLVDYNAVDKSDISNFTQVFNG